MRVFYLYFFILLSLQCIVLTRRLTAENSIRPSTARLLHVIAPRSSSTFNFKVQNTRLIHRQVIAISVGSLL